MRYAKPQDALHMLDLVVEGGGVMSWVREVRLFLSSLPDSFEIVPEGHVCVKWPEGCSRGALEMSADHLSRFAGTLFTVHALRALAAIAPEKPRKRKVALYEFLGHGDGSTQYGSIVGFTHGGPMPGGFPWRKVGECEIEE